MVNTNVELFESKETPDSPEGALSTDITDLNKAVSDSVLAVEGGLEQADVQFVTELVDKGYDAQVSFWENNSGGISLPAFPTKERCLSLLLDKLTPATVAVMRGEEGVKFGWKKPVFRLIPSARIDQMLYSLFGAGMKSSNSRYKLLGEYSSFPRFDGEMGSHEMDQALGIDGKEIQWDCELAEGSRGHSQEADFPEGLNCTNDYVEFFQESLKDTELQGVDLRSLISAMIEIAASTNMTQDFCYDRRFAPVGVGNFDVKPVTWAYSRQDGVGFESIRTESKEGYGMTLGNGRILDCGKSVSPPAFDAEGYVFQSALRVRC